MRAVRKFLIAAIDVRRLEDVVRTVERGAAIDAQTIPLPAGARILHVALQRDQICLWALVDPDAEVAPVKAWIIGTGHRVVADEWRHAGTVQIGDFMWHVFLEAQP